MAARATIAALVAAWLAGDRVRLDEVAERMGSAPLAKALAEGSRAERLAVIAATPRAPEGVWLLAPMCELAGAADRSLAAPASRALVELAVRVAAEREDVEPPVDVIDEARASCTVLAGRAALSPDIRVAGLECAMALAGDEASDLPTRLLGDNEPEVARAAAYWLCAEGPPANAPVAERIAALADGTDVDPDDRLVLKSCIVRP